MSSSDSGRPFWLPGGRKPGRGRKSRLGSRIPHRLGTVTVAALVVATLLPSQAWALPPVDARDAIELEAVQESKELLPDEGEIEKLTSWSGEPLAPPAEYIPSDVAPPAQDTGTVPLDQAGEGLMQVDDLPVSLGKATPTEDEPNPPAPSGTWGVTVEAREATEAAHVDGAIITVTPPSTGSTPVDVELDYSKFQDLFGTEWASRLKLVQFPACFATTPTVPECATPVDVPSTNDPSAQTVRATIDPAASPVQGMATQTGSNESAVLAAIDAAAGAGGTYRATSLAPSGSWTHGGSSGGFSWTYPLTVPAPPAGPAPKIAFSYSSQSVDGRTSVANGQASWIGDGWDYHPGFVERRYRTCSDDRAGSPNNVSESDKKKTDLCWASDSLLLSLGGSSTELVHDADRRWVPANDDGVKVEYLDGAGKVKTTSQDGKYAGEHWRVTSRDGTRYYFGRNDLDGTGTRAHTNSVFTVPVFGNHSGDPCHQATYASSACTQAWRWNLDYVEDVHGNAMVVDWQQEINYYAQNEGYTASKAYVRGGYPKQILYGLRVGNLTGPPAGKVVFTANERCATGTACPAAKFDSANYADKQPWWDTPSTLHCKAGAENCYSSAPTFWTRVKLAAVTTYGQRLQGSTDLFLVDKWELHQSFPKHRTDTHPPLWLESIRRTGYAAPDSTGKQDNAGTSLPDVSFIANVVDMPNRVATSADDDTPDFDRLRVETIRTETGGEIYVDYSAPCPVGSSHPSPETNTTRCFPTKWSPDPELENPPVEWFNKYVVEKIVEKDRVAREPDVTTQYFYGTPVLDGSGQPVMEGDKPKYTESGAWAKNTDEFTKPELRTYDQWRGYDKVTVRRGETSSDGLGAATEQSQKVTRYFRGMSRDAGRPAITLTLKDAAGATVSVDDSLPFQGRAAETVTYTKADGSIAAREVTKPYAEKTASRARGDGLPALEAYRTGTDWADTIQTVSGGKTRSTRIETEERDGYDLPLKTHTYTLSPNDEGVTVKSNESCTTTSYVHNADNHLIGLPQRVRSTVGPCSSAASATGNQVVSDARTSYDALGAFGTAPVKGLPRQVDTINGEGTGWTTTVRTEYDALGRPTKTIDAESNATSTTYSPATGAPFQITVTNPLEHAATSTIDPARGTVLSVIDANGRKTTSRYDELGRLTDVWSPARNPATDKASAHFDYQIAADKVPVVTTQTLRDNGTYEDSVTIYDGQLRPRQTQTEAIGGGRIITDTLYNANGTVRETKNGYFTTDEPEPKIFVPLSYTEVPNSTKTAYDGLGRAIRTTTLYKGDPQHSTTTQYGGDWTLSRTGMSADGTTPLAGSRAAKTWTDAAGRTTKIQHYTTTSLTGPAPASIDTHYAYDARGKLAEVTDAKGNSWTYTYDVRGRQKETTDPDIGSTTFGYNELDQKIWSKDSRQRAQHTLYDPLGRTTELRDDSPTGSLIAKWTYDTLPGAKGYPVATTRYYGTAEYKSETTGYDAEYRPTGSKITIPKTDDTTGLDGTYTYTNTYTATGKPQSVTLPATPGGLAAEKVITRYNGEGSPLTTSGLTWYTAGTLYSPFGKVLRTTSGEAGARVWTTTAYDELTGRLDKTVAQRETINPIWSSVTQYGYDKVGNVTSITGTQTETTSTQKVSKSDQQCFAYDPMGRLVHAWTGTEGCAPATTAQGAGPAAGTVSTGTEGNGYWQEYAFDSIGNRSTLTVHDPAGVQPAQTYSYTYGKTVENNLTQPPTTAQPHTLVSVESTQNADGTSLDLRQSFTYDASGNTTERVTAGGATATFAWDRRNKLTSVDTDNNGTANVTYLYDASGNRLIENNGTTRTLFLGEAEITVNTAGQALNAQRYYGHPGAPTTVRSTGGKTTGHKLTVLLSDHHNTATTAIEQTSNQAVTRRFFDPYGNPRGTQPTDWPSRHTFLGTGIDDPTTGLTHIGAREYDPTTGRFLSADPIMDLADPLQMNGYTYANATPVTQSDPTGLKSDECASLYKCSGDQVITTSTTQYQSEATVAEYYRRNMPALTIANWKSEGLGNMPWHGMAKKVTGWKNPYYERNWGWNMLAGVGRWLVGESAIALPAPMVGDVLTAGYDAAVSSIGVDTNTRSYESGQVLMDMVSLASPAGAAKSVARKATKCVSNSFAEGTEVLLADGTTKPIENIETGDQVLATDPETSETRTETVTTEIVGQGKKNLVRITIDTDGIHGTKTATVTATDGHPFWVPELGEWLDATALRPGQWLQTSIGTYAQITAIQRWTQNTTVHNLTVSNLHTYYVLAGATPVLVHNCNGVPDVGVSRSRHPESAQHIEDAQAAGQPDHLTIDRGGAKKRRAESMRGNPVVAGKDRDEYPPAMFQEGGTGSSVRPIDPGDNRGAGSVIRHQCTGLPNGTVVHVVVCP